MPGFQAWKEPFDESQDVSGGVSPTLEPSGSVTITATTTIYHPREREEAGGWGLHESTLFPKKQETAHYPENKQKNRVLINSSRSAVTVYAPQKRHIPTLQV